MPASPGTRGSFQFGPAQKHEEVNFHWHVVNRSIFTSLCSLIPIMSIYLFGCSCPHCFGIFPQLLHIVIGHQTLSNWTLLHQGGCLASCRLRDCTEHGWNLNPKCCRAAVCVCVFSPISSCIYILWNSPIFVFSQSFFIFSLHLSLSVGKPAPAPILIHCDWLT